MAQLHVLIPCAGVGSRFGTTLAKQYQPLLGQTVLDWTLRLFLARADIASVSLVHSVDDKYIQAYQERYPRLNLLAQGGASRALTVKNGLAAITNCRDQDWVLVHDAARCCLHNDDLTRLISAVIRQQVGGILAAAATDTIKQVNLASLRVNATLEREQIYLAQTPQMFCKVDLQEALTTADLALVTDEASAIEQLGKPVQIVAAEHPNLKITYRHDLDQAGFILQSRLSKN